MSRIVNGSNITTIIFDMDDTLYDVGTGFTAHRMIGGVQSFMMKYLNFPTLDAAQQVFNDYFTKYHSTAKALRVAEADGKLPPNDLRTNGPLFDAQDWANYLATELNYELLGPPDQPLIEMLQQCPLKLVVFSNGPRRYVLRVLQEMKLDSIFPEDRVFGVDDVLPSCKPEAEAFQMILDKIGSVASECIMVEDSMKNIRGAKQLGMTTVLVAGKGKMKKAADSSSLLEDENTKAVKESESTKRGDLPDHQDPAVDFAVEVASEMRNVLPMIWE